MDSLTQAVLGAGLQGALLGRWHGRKALAAGAVLATLPDLDVVIRHADLMTAMVAHRGFSHSLLVLTIAAGLLTWLWRYGEPTNNYGPGRLFLALWLVLATHPLLDAFTAYGTQLFWPWRPVPTAWSSLFIIDPFFTLPLASVVIAGFICGTGPRLRRLLVWTLIYCAAYIGLSLGAKQLAESRARQAAADAGHKVTAVFSTPEPFSILLWRVVARTDDDHYLEAVTGLLDRRPPEMLRLPLNSHLAGVLPAEHPLSGLRWFSGDWLRYDVIGDQLVVTDLRMGVGTGYYSFRFLVARQAGDDWQPLTPARWTSEHGRQVLGQVIRRIWFDEPPLPLADWEPRMHQQSE